MNMLESNTNIM